MVTFWGSATECRRGAAKTQHNKHVPSTYHSKDANPRADGSHSRDDVKLPSLVEGPREEPGQQKGPS